MYKLRSWIDESKLTNELSLNPNAVEYLEDHPDKIDYYYISKNINAIHIIEKNLNKCSKDNLNRNPNMITLLRNNRSLIVDYLMCYHEHAIEFVNELIENEKFDKISWACLTRNSAAIHVLEQYPEKIDWFYITHNKNAEHLIRNNLEKIEHYWYSICSKPNLIRFVEEHPEKIDWRALTTNYNAEHLLKNNLEKIYVDNLRYNKNGFELLLQSGHQFSSEHHYDIQIVYAFFDYCMTHNIEFTLIRVLCEYGYTDEHFEFIKTHPIYYDYLSRNPNIFVYDYTRMKKTRQQQPWYHNIKNEFI